MLPVLLGCLAVFSAALCESHQFPFQSLQLHFVPTRLEIIDGHNASGYVNVTFVLKENVDVEKLTEDFMMQWCCVHDHIAGVMSSQEIIPIRNPSSYGFYLTMRGLKLGRTQVRFFIMSKDSQSMHQNQSPVWSTESSRSINATILEPTESVSMLHYSHTGDYSATHEPDSSRPAQSTKLTPSQRAGSMPENDHSCPKNGSPDHLEVWWLQNEYETIVKNPERPGGRYLNYALMGLVAVNLVALGGHINLNEAVDFVKKPIGLTLAFFCRFGIIPAVSD